MAALNFPTGPTLNQTYTANGKTWTWDGTSWTISSSGGGGAGGGGATVTVSETAPAAPTANSLWYSSEEGQLKIYYDDTSSQQWVDVAGGNDGVGNSFSTVVFNGATSGTVSMAAPAIAGSSVQTLVAVTDTLAPIVRSTHQATTTGTNKEWLNIPSWAKRITVLFDEVSTSGTSGMLIQIGSGSFVITGYVATAADVGNAATASISSVAGFPVRLFAATNLVSGEVRITAFGNANRYIASGSVKSVTTNGQVINGSVALSGPLDRVRVITLNGTDTLDAGAINIMYE